MVTVSLAHISKNGYTFPITTRQWGNEIVDGITVPNGKWVCELPVGCSAQLVGVEPNEVTTVTLDARDPNNPRVLYVNDDRPFGFVTWKLGQNRQPIEMTAAESLRFVSARQIHNGELGQTIPTRGFYAVPGVVTEPIEKATFHNLRRAREGWVRIWKLGQSLQMKPHEVLQHYVKFGLNRRRDEAYATIEIAETPYDDDIRVGYHGLHSLADHEAVRFVRTSEDVCALWVRKAFAVTILRMNTIGYIPEPITA